MQPPKGRRNIAITWAQTKHITKLSCRYALDAVIPFCCDRASCRFCRCCCTPSAANLPSAPPVKLQESHVVPVVDLFLQMIAPDTEDITEPETLTATLQVEVVQRLVVIEPASIRHDVDPIRSRGVHIFNGATELIQKERSSTNGAENGRWAFSLMSR